MEIADLVVINKADGPLIAAAEQARNEVTAALRFMRPRLQSWRPKVHTRVAVMTCLQR